jgi:hypothetical protein
VLRDFYLVPWNFGVFEGEGCVYYWRSEHEKDRLGFLNLDVLLFVCVCMNSKL